MSNEPAPAPAPILPEMDDSPTNSEPTEQSPDSSVSHAGCTNHEKSPVVGKTAKMLSQEAKEL